MSPKVILLKFMWVTFGTSYAHHYTTSTMWVTFGMLVGQWLIIIK